jgi:hypothetical protein
METDARVGERFLSRFRGESIAQEIVADAFAAEGAR